MELIRYGISLPEILSRKFDQLIKKKKYTNRSEAIRDLIRHALVEEEIKSNVEVLAVVNLLYNHHKRELSERLTELQHKHHHLVLSSMHVHLDHTNCLETIVMQGMSQEIKQLADLLIASKGVKHGKLSLTSTGKNLD
ncbi:MAG: nickel-responsive transcriptional regulator NikR [Calditrichia bacterium]|nr:nickel-responsive transcriptional regulator NikR [Calditrichia bacterium]